MISILKISHSLTKIFKNYGIDLVSSKANNLMTLLGNTKNIIEEGRKSGIYGNNFEECM